MSDQELIQGIKTRNNSVIKELLDLYQKYVILTCYSLVHDEEDARDLSQEVFLELLNSVDAFKGHSKLSTWIYRIAVNKSLNHLKKAKRKELFERMETLFHKQEKKHNASFFLSDSSADLDLAEKERRTMLNRIIDELPQNQRIAFILSKYDELSYKEIAEVMNLSASAVESLIHRAKMNLQNKLIRFYQKR